MTDVENTTEAKKPSSLRTFYYWAALLITLIMVDDATFGWIFWLLSQINPMVSAAAAIAIYWFIGYWITLRGLEPNPGKIASKLLNRLQLERKNPELRRREKQLKNSISSIGIAVPMSLLFGGVVTTLWLRRRNVVDQAKARKVAFWLCGLYAAEFAAIHALGIGGSIFWMRH